MDIYALEYMVKVLCTKYTQKNIEDLLGKQGLIVLTVNVIQDIAEKDSTHKQLDKLLKLLGRL